MMSIGVRDRHGGMRGTCDTGEQGVWEHGTGGRDNMRGA